MFPSGLIGGAAWPQNQQLAHGGLSQLGGLGRALLTESELALARSVTRKQPVKPKTIILELQKEVDDWLKDWDK